MAYLARELSTGGYNVTYIAAEPISPDRISLGWTLPNTGELPLIYVTDVNQINELSSNFSPEAVHITQGIRGNGYILDVIEWIIHNKARWCVIMETIDDSGLAGLIKRQIYTYKLSHPSKIPDFLLAIGEKTPKWVAERGYPEKRIFPFTYFLETAVHTSRTYQKQTNSFRVGFVGQLVKLKRVDLLIEALATNDFNQVSLVVVGTGPLEKKLKLLCDKKLNHLSIEWLGKLPLSQARKNISGIDCLVLPSDYDGWGVVVSEALMAGVPVICSDGCGASLAVRASGLGGVFPSGDYTALRQLLIKVKSDGQLNYKKKKHLADWAKCLGANSGANYLGEILDSVYKGTARPTPPWF